MTIHVLPAFSDNFIFVLEEPARPGVAVVDPGDAGPVFAFLDAHRLRLESILVTHHHRDHTGGVPALVERFGRVPVYGGARDRGRIPHQTAFVEDGDTLDVLGHAARVLHVPGHTLGHVAYFVPDPSGGGDLFSGDTVFGCTVGNLFEGTPDDMFLALQRIRRLPESTRLWCAHEYTLTYVAEAAHADPGNAILAERLARVRATVAAGRPTVPLLLSDERATSPFFRWDDPALQAKLGTADGRSTFERLCAD